MKKIIFKFILLPALLLAGFPAQAALRVFSCEPEWASLAEELGGDKLDIFSATHAQQDVHYIQARPSLIARLRRADLMICTGADLEIGWLPVLLRQAANPTVQPGLPGFFEASAFAKLLEVPDSVDRAQGDVHPFGNPHIQLDPRNIAKIAAALALRLQSLDPDNADFYRQRYADFDRRWQEKTKQWTERAKPLAGMGLIVYHRSWVYLVDWLSLREVGALEPKPGIPPSAGHLASILQRIESQDVALTVRSVYQSSRATEWIARRSDVPAVVLPHTVGATAGADDLFGLFDSLVDILLEHRR
ncbi:MAG: zinc ABC transporter substrate-binding protein [Proteobacteria bacterium]|nr:zinc ABC transporter substrate-binding protein [Pseudomonadota bacterium]